jgi:GAF domain-containing protein
LLRDRRAIGFDLDESAANVEIELLRRELAEARSEQAATADVLRVISRSASDFDEALNTLISSVVELCKATQGVIWLLREGQLYLATQVGYAPEWVEFARSHPITLSADAQFISGLAAFTGEVVNVEDIPSDPRFRPSAGHALGNYRAGLAVPLKRDGVVKGVITLSRPEARLYSEREVALVQTFADQAVIAIENVRLYDEAQQRNRELTATSEVLQVISRSPADVQPVFEAIAKNAALLCNSQFAYVHQFDGTMVRMVAHYGLSPEVAEEVLRPFPMPLGRGGVGARTIASGNIEQVPDYELDPDYDYQRSAWLVGVRSAVGVPMLRHGKPVGAIVLDRAETGYYPERQISLLRTFADQAVIAIENVRLFEEVRARTTELSEALEQQTSTAEVLKAISRSALDLDTVLNTLVESAAALCGANLAQIFRWDGTVLRWAAGYALNEEYLEVQKGRQYELGPDSLVGRTALDRQTVHILDVMADAEYGYKNHARIGNIRTILGVPLLRSGEFLGVIAVARDHVEAFTDKQIEIVTTFADQAVIAIENVRLFEQVQAKTRDLSEALKQQIATADVLKAISRSTFDLQTVLNTLVESAAGLCGANVAQIFRFDGEMLSWAAGFALNPEYLKIQSIKKYPPNKDSLVGRVTITRQTILILDALADADYGYKEDVRVGNIRTMLGVPLMQSGDIIGVIAVARDHVEPFTEKQIELVQTFADQAVIAIENARLFEEVQARTRELSESLQQQTATADVLKVISRSAFDLNVVFQTLLDSAARLCAADRGVISRREGDLLRVVAGYQTTPEHFAYEQSHPHPIGRGTFHGRAALERTTIHVPDVLLDPEWERPETAVTGKFRAVLAVPIRREGDVVGVFGLGKEAPGPFTPRQVELAETFADQAAIAIENIRLFDEVQARTRDLQQSLEYQTATSEVLNVISRSPTELQPVLDVIIETAVRLCEADFGTIAREREGKFVRTGEYGTISGQFKQLMSNAPVEMTRGTITGRTLVEGKVVHVLDAEIDPEYTWGEALALEEIRTGLGVPLLREGTAIGAIALVRRTVKPFTPKQIELVTTFADQAVIAIENARLFEEVQSRNRELTDALERQTATGAILSAIAASPTDVQPVLDAVVESAARLCEARDATIFLRDGDELVVRAHHGPIPLSRSSVPIGRDWLVGRVVMERNAIQVEDLLATGEEFPGSHQMALLSGHRTTFAMPLIREDDAIGALLIRRTEVRPFSAKQMDVLKIFADQAVIAIQNVRLFEEVQTRNRDLRIALEQQTATSELLKVIGRSTFDLQPVFERLAESAVRLCEAERAVVFRYDGEFLRAVAWHNPSSELRDFLAANPIRLGRHTGAARAGLERKTIHIHDLRKDSEYSFVAAQIDPVRTILAVPMLRGDELLGVTVIYRLEVRPFAESHVALMETFSDQAVIAIENARLFDEVQARTAELTEALQQQTATAEVLKIISRSAFDLKSVLQTLVESAARLCDAEKATITREIDGKFYRAEAYGFSPDFMEYVRGAPVELDKGSASGRALLLGKVIHIADVEKDPEYTFTEAKRLGGFRTILGVPMLREGTAIGVLALTRAEVRPFTDKQIELVSTFADQAAIAIENVRLFESVEARTRDLMRSLEDLRTAQDRLIQTEKLASLGQLTAGIAHEIKNPLNFVNNFSAMSVELLGELRELIDHSGVDERRRADVDDLMTMLKSNLEKVNQHGRRADSIVKNMLLHSRQGSGEHRLVNINAIVEESLNLAYHGARAERQGFNITLERSLDPQAGEVDLYPQEITRVLLNLISNGFYATIKRSAEANGENYEPTLMAATRALGERVEIRIRDNGIGIPPEVREKIFLPFFTTKPAGEGTGLGLSLSYDIIVKQHAGSIEVDTQAGAFTEFRIVLPRAAASLGKPGEKA